MGVTDFHGIITFQCAIEQIADWYPRLFLEPHIVACVAVINPYSAPPKVRGGMLKHCFRVARSGNAVQTRGLVVG
jgi:hypothetical protein